MSATFLSRRFSDPGNAISFDPYIVWRTLVLANPDMLLIACDKHDLSDDPSIADFAMSICSFPDDLQNLLFAFAQHHGVAAAHRALDQAVETAYRIEREAWLDTPAKQDLSSATVAEPTTESMAECDAA